MNKIIQQILCGLGVVFLHSANAGGADENYNSSIIFGPSETSSNLPYLTPYNDTGANLILQLNDNVLEEKLLTGIHEIAWYEEETPISLILPIHLSSFIGSNRDFTTERASELLAFVTKLHQDYYQYRQDNKEALKNSYLSIKPQPDFTCCYYCAISDMDAMFDYIEAIQKSALDESQKYQLAYARYQFFQEKENYKLSLKASDFTDPVSQDFYRYLVGATNFASGQYSLAKEAFSPLLQSENPWLKEVAVYLEARISLKEAQNALLDPWMGEITESTRGTELVTQSRAEFQRYLETYPKGLYHYSAQGLMRRLAWLEGNDIEVVRELERWHAEPSKYLRKDNRYNDRVLQLILEVDRKVIDLYGDKKIQTESPKLLAIKILQSMRPYHSAEAKSNGYYTNKAKENNTFDQLVGQYQPYFKDDDRLYQFLVATYYAHVDPQSQKVTELLPVLDERKKILSTFELSEQILRARAFEAQKRWSAAETIWQELYKRIETPMQRELIEVGIAGNYVLADRVERAFQLNSSVTLPALRDSLVVDHASRKLMRDLIMDSPDDMEGIKKEQARWLYILLYRDIYTINSSAFFADLKLMEQFQNMDTKVVASFDFFQQPIKNAYQYDCQTPIQVMKNLSKNPNNSHAQMCYSFMVESMPAYKLSGSLQFAHLKPSLWKSQRITNYDSYRRVIDNPKANKNDRALALYHGINCYNRGINRCDDRDIPESERKRWFDTLKREHSDSQWARKQKYYW